MRFIILLVGVVFSQEAVLNIEATTHNIKEGQSLSALAQEYNMEWADIYAFNKDKIGVNPDMIHPDTTIQIPLNTYYTIPPPATYHLEFVGFLILMAIFIWVYYKKQLGAPNSPQTVVVESKPQIIERSTEVSIDNVSGKKKGTSEVAIEENKTGGSWKNAETNKVELPSEKLKSKVDQKKLKEKLKKIRG